MPRPKVSVLVFYTTPDGGYHSFSAVVPDPRIYDIDWEAVVQEHDSSGEFSHARDA